MNILRKWVLGLAIILLGYSCNLFVKEQEVGGGSISVLLSGMSTGRNSRTLAPSISLDVDHYLLSGAGPDGSTFGPINVTTDSAFIQDLAFGNWTIKAAAYNEAEDKIGEGNVEVAVEESGPTSATITVTPVQGDGTLTLNLDWPSGAILGATIQAYLTPDGGAKTIKTLTINGATATFAGTLAAGYYTLEVYLYDESGNLRYPWVEVVRILSGKKTKGEKTIVADDDVPDSAQTPEFSVDEGSYSEAQTITITSSTPGASIRYSLEGSPPSETVGTLYTVPITIVGNCTLKAVAYKTNLATSPIAVANYTITDGVKAPRVNIYAGTYYGSVAVSFASVGSDEVLVYTKDGNDPAPGSTGQIYDGSSINLSSTTTIKAIVAKIADFTKKSNVVESIYTITGILADPTFSVDEGSHSMDKNLIITSETGTEVRYTTDGSEPSSTNGSTYSQPISINKTMTVKAYATRNGWGSSNIISKTYSMDVGIVTFSIDGGTYSTDQSLTLGTVTQGAEIRYTTEAGSQPTSTTGTVYTTAIAIDKSMTITAKAFRQDWNPSTSVSAVYIMKVGEPTVSLPVGTFHNDQSTSLSTVTVGATIRYTLDGSEPSEEVGTIYQDPIPLSASTTVKAIAYKENWTTSDKLGSGNGASYILTVAPVTFTPMPAAPKIYPVTVTIRTETDKVSIVYTLNGTTPTRTTNGTYGTSVQITGPTTLTAMAFRTGWPDSTPTQVNY